MTRPGFGVLTVLLLCAAAGFSSAAADLCTGFIENLGQVNDAVRYYMPGSRASVYFTAAAVVIDLREPVSAPPEGGRENLARGHEPVRDEPHHGCAVWIRFEGANASPQIEARDQQVTRYNYFLGNDPERWRTGVLAFGEVIYRELWPGIDLAYRQEEGRLIYEVTSRPGADLQAVRFTYEGADRVEVLGDGSFRIETSAGEFSDFRPTGESDHGMLVWGDGSADQGGGGAGSGTRDNPDALVWSTFLGGSNVTGEDQTRGVTLDPDSNPIVTGHTDSSDFPTTPGAYDTSYGGSDAFVAKLSASGDALLWSTFLGGSGTDYAHAITLGSAGGPVVAGCTYSSDFPTTSRAYDLTYNGGGDGFVAHLGRDGNALRQSTFLGGSSFESIDAISTSQFANFDVVVTGNTLSSDFPVTLGAYDRSYNGDYDGFVARLAEPLHSGEQVLSWSSFLGGVEHEEANALALDDSENPVVSGMTSSPQFPTTAGAYDRVLGGDADAFVCKLSSSGRELLWSTFVGGSAGEAGHALAIDASGTPVICGYTNSADFPTTPGSYDTSCNGGLCEVFITKLNASASSLVWSTFLGGSQEEYVEAITLDGFGNPFVTGYTCSHDFPTKPGDFDTSLDGDWDAYVVKLNAAGSALLRGSFLGGDNGEIGSALSVDSGGMPVVTGVTESADFPTTPGAYGRFLSGINDVFVVKWDAVTPIRFLVEPDGSGDYATIQAAIDVASFGDIVELADGVFTGPGNRDLDFHGKAITVRSQSGDPESCVIECQGSPTNLHRGFYFHSGEGAGSRVEGITITHGYAPSTNGGGGILCDGSTAPVSPTIVNCVFVNNTALTEGGRGGAIYSVLESAPQISHSSFIGNAAPYGGAVYAYGGSLALEGCTFYGNTGTDSGGNLYIADCAVTVTNSILGFGGGGGSVYCWEGGSITLTCCDVFGNVGGDYVGCIAGQQGLNGNISQDPLFCDAPAGDLTVSSDSPCAPAHQPVCGWIGAYETGCGPDLRIEYVFPDTVMAGQPATLDIIIGNDGDTGAPATLTRVRIDGEVVCAEIPTPEFAAGGMSVFVQCELPGLSAGTHTVEVCADVTDLVAETNEQNNCLTQPLYVLSVIGDCSIVAWGLNDQGQCDVPSPNGEFIAVAGGGTHGLGLKSDGEVVAWGDNGSGQCDVPAPNDDFIAVAAGVWHSLGLKSDGVIVAWGSDAQGQCTVPAPNEDFVAVAAGGYHSLGLKSDGSVVAWGYNELGACTVPEPNEDFIAVSGGEYHSLGLKRDGSIVGWGYNTSGQCDVPEPNEGFVAVAGGGYHSLGLKADGSIVGWGLCVNGQCSVPEPNEDFVAVAGGGYHSLGLKRDGMILAWGYNANGQCSVPEPNGDFVSLAGGGSHSLGIRCETHLYVLQPDGSGDFPTIQAALNAAAPRDTVELADGTYTGTGNRDLDFLGKAVVLRSQSGDPRLCTIECQGSPESLHRGVHFQAGEGYDTRVEGITIAHGYAPNTDGGGGIFCDGSGGPASPTLSDCIFLDNMALYGGGRGGAMYVTHNSSPRVEGCTFLAGSAHYGGGIYAYRSGLQVDSSTFYYVWEGSCQGSAIVSDSATVGVTNCILSFSPNGRAVGCYGDGTVTLSCCDVYGNAGGDYVGCIAGQQGVDGNISLNPLFCDAPAGDLTLESGSPCAEENNPGCGRIGAWPVGCEGSSGVGDGRIVTVLYLDPPVPNPSQSTLGITYGLPGETEALVQLSIFDASGRRVRTLVNGLQKPGAYRLTWDGADESRAPVASGVYFMKLSWESQTIARRVLLLR